MEYISRSVMKRGRRSVLLVCSSCVSEEIDLVCRALLDGFAHFPLHGQERLILVGIDRFHGSLAKLCMDVDLRDAKKSLS